jgi:hypothetical protein
MLWTLLYWVFLWSFCFRGKPGLGPAAEVLSFASPKESTQRKGEPETVPLRGPLRCSCRAGLAQTRLRLKHAPS